MVIFLAGKTEVASMPGGVVGQISFQGIVNALRAVGYVRDTETITHIRIDVRHGAFEFRIEDEK